MRITFVIVVIAFYLAANYYVFIRSLSAIPCSCIAIRVIYGILFALLALSFIISMSASNEKFPQMLTILQPIGSTWLFSLLYIIPTLLIIDLIRLLNKWLHFIPSFVTTNPQLTSLIACTVIVISLAVLFICGSYKFNHPTVVKLNVKSNKQIASQPRIVIASDLHIGYIIGRKKTADYVKLINDQHPDIVLLCGDIFDRSVAVIERNNIPAILRQINAPLGVYAVVGNHEYFGNLPRAVELLKQSNIVVLRDSVVKITDDIYLIGRDDKSNPKRQSLKTLTSNLDYSKLIIDLDHQPSSLDEAQSVKADFQFSGHTHDGQLYPVNLLTRRLYEKSHGYLIKGSTQYYVTSGLGLWGAPYRIGTQSELILLSIETL
ncbi:MAG: metallophosphoesterase [Bacteroidales bacterium]|jgi:predicted MPP superfamily phosphohydrolase|nr:metallophosphoesterase [Bacteroidales bacterium]